MGPILKTVVIPASLTHTVLPMAKSQKSLKGCFLLDGGNLSGSFFHRTVVLICKHDAEGAFGLILNRPLGATVGEAVPGNLPEALRPLPLLAGGPVQEHALSYLYSEPGLTGETILPELLLGHDLDQLVDWAESPSLTRKLLVFAGYAGWSPGQLEDEMRRRAWLTHPANHDWIFSLQPETLWRRIVSRKGWRLRLLAEEPDDLSLN